MDRMGSDARRITRRKDLFDMLNTMREAAWNSFNERRQHEWKICITLWSLLVLFPAALVGNKIDLATWQRVAASVAIGLLALLHGVFMSKLANALRIDRVKAQYYENRMRDLTGTRLGLEHHVRVRRSESWPGVNRRARSAKEQLAKLKPDVKPDVCQVLRQALYETASPVLSSDEHSSYRDPQGPDLGPCSRCQHQQTCQDMLPVRSVFGFWSHALQIAFSILLAACGVVAILTLTQVKQGPV